MRADVLNSNSNSYGKLYLDSNIKIVTATSTLEVADSGKIILVNPAADTTIGLPDVGNVGWNCKIVLSAQAAGADGGMSHIVNIDLGSGANLANVGMIQEIDGTAGDQAVANDDFIVNTASANPGNTFDIFTDGSRWYVQGVVADLTDSAFSTGADTIA